MIERTWMQITLSVPHTLEDALSDFLTTLTGRGVCLREARDKVLIDAFFEPEGSEEQMLVLDRHLEDLARMGLLAEGTRYEVTELPEEDWMAVFRGQHTIVRVSDRLVVRPTWCESAGGSEIVLDPGMAFGTGSHFTTRMCLTLVDEIIGFQPPDRMFDLGTGSGILAIAGAYLGVGDVLAADIDPVAVDVASRNVLNNKVDDRVTVVEGSVDAAEGLYDIITANLSASLLKRLAPDIASHLAPDGRLVISGFLDAEEDEVAAAFKTHGLYIEKVLREKVWATALLQRPPQ